MRIPVVDPESSPFSPAQASQINTLFSGLGGDQAAWLLGFFGAANQLLKPAEASPKPVNGAPHLTVLYASQTGNAAKVAKQLATAATKAGIHCAAVDVADYKLARLREERYLVLISSTQGEGDPPDSAAEFHRLLMGKRAPRLEGLRFAVLALGDESYDHFCKAGADFDRRFEELGAERQLARVECDVEFQAVAETWQQQVIEVFRPVVTSEVITVSPPASAAQDDKTAPDKEHPFPAAVLERINLNGRGAEKKTLHLEVSLSGSGISYQPGDAIGVLPRNSPTYVSELLATTGLPPDAGVSVDGGNRPLAEALGELFEVTTITRPFVKAYAAETGHAELAALLDKGNQDAFRSYCRGREIIDVLQKYQPRGLSPQSFVAMLRRLQPRLYSIASSLLAHPEEAHLLVGLTRYESHGRMREGVCSGYLCERLGEDEPLRVYMSPNPGFKLPADPDARIIMVGPGTGVAPFRAFVEEREAASARGRNWLFFGDQHFATDFLYQLEWQRWYKSGALSRLDLAFSRDQADKVYVQNRMLAASRDLYAWLQAGAYLYVCGDASNMAADVHEALLAIVSKESGKDREAALEYVEALRASKRYQRDVY